MSEAIASRHLSDFVAAFPFSGEFFDSFAPGASLLDCSIEAWLDTVSDEALQDQGMDRPQVLDYLQSLCRRMENDCSNASLSLHELTLIGGRDKSGRPEPARITIRPGDILCVVGPTGSGKSRLLADIECLAQRDTPTQRQILVNGQVPDSETRFGLEHKLVAQISQNMNYVVDLTVQEFLTMHARSRLRHDSGEIVERILHCANDLTGEKFEAKCSVTQLSGGQSRALMIADTALLSASPIVLIDEIENAGVDRKHALELLVKREKIVFISTHDPLLALLGTSRLVIRNGGIAKVIRSTSKERANLARLERLDAFMMELRNRVRNGERIEADLFRPSGEPNAGWNSEAALA